MARFPQPPRKEELQRVLVPTGRPIYKDVDGVNELDKYYMPDNVEGRKPRPIQTGRYVNFTGVENIFMAQNQVSCDRLNIKFNVKNTSGVDVITRYIYDTTGVALDVAPTERLIIAINRNAFGDRVINLHVSGTWFTTTVDLSDELFHDIELNIINNSLTVYNDGVLDSTFVLSGNITTYSKSGSSTRIGSSSTGGGAFAKANLASFELETSLVGTVNYAFKYNCDDASGLVARDALTVDGNYGTIDLGGSTESSFHATDPEVPSRQNEVGFSDLSYSQDFIGLSTYPDGWSFKNNNISIGPHADGLLVTVAGENGGINYDANLPAYGFTNIKYRVKKISGTFNNFSLSYNNQGNEGFVVGVVIGVWYEIELSKTNFFDIPLDNTSVQARSGTSSGDQFVIQSYIQDVDVKIPIAEDGDGKTDVLGNTVPYNYYGEVRKEALLTGASCMNFDGNLYGKSGTLSELEIDNVELEVEVIKIGGAETNVRIGSFRDPAGSRGGWALVTISNGDTIRLYIGDNFQQELTLSKSFTDTSKRVFGFKKFGTTTQINEDGNYTNVTYYAFTPWNGSEGLRIGAIHFATATSALGNKLILSYKVWELDSSGNRINELINYNGSEVNGLTFFNTAVDRPALSDAQVVLGGSSDGNQYSDSEFQRPINLLNGFTRAGYIGSVTHLIISDTLVVLPVNFEFQTKFVRPIGETFGDIFFDNKVLADSKLGIFSSSIGTLNIRIFNIGRSIGVIDLVDGVQHTINVKLFGTTVIIAVDDIEIFNETITLGSQVGAGAFIGVLPVSNPRGVSYISELIIYELDGSGDRTTEKYNLDFVNGDETSVPNKAAGAPTDSDATWSPADDGKYTNIPADGNTGFDVTGGVLGVKGSSIALNPSEVEVVFNPYGDPELHVMGLIDIIKLNYAGIVANQSTFHDNKVANKVEKLLAYSDFQYPIAGSIAKIDGNLYADFGQHNEFEIDAFEFEILFSFNSIGAIDFLFTNGTTAFTADKGGFEIRHDAGVGFGLTFFYPSGTPVIRSIGIIGVVDTIYRLNIKRYGINFAWELNENSGGDAGLTTDAIRYSAEAPLAPSRIGVYKDTLHTDTFDRIPDIDLYAMKLWKANSSTGVREEELLNPPFAEEAGLTYFNAAEDRPSGSDGIVDLRGSSDGDQFIQDANLDYHHNLQFGESSPIVIDDDFLEMQPWADPTIPDGWVGFGIRDANTLIEENASGCRIFSSTAFMGMDRLILTSGRRYKLTIDVQIVTSGQISIGSTSGGADIIPFIATSGIYTVNFTSISTTLSIKRGTGIGDDVVIRSIKVEQLTKVPGDPNNFGFDVNDEPVDNLPEVIKYRRIKDYTRISLAAPSFEVLSFEGIGYMIIGSTNIIG